MIDDTNNKLEPAGPTLEDVINAALAEGGDRTITITSGPACAVEGPFAGKTEDEIVDELVGRIAVVGDEGEKPATVALPEGVTADDVFLTMCAIAGQADDDGDAECIVCGDPTPEGELFCPSCGTDYEVEEEDDDAG